MQKITLTLKTNKMKVFLVEARDWDESNTIAICSSIEKAKDAALMFCKKEKLTITKENQYEDGTLYIKTIDRFKSPDRTIVIIEYNLDEY